MVGRDLPVSTLLWTLYHLWTINSTKPFLTKEKIRQASNWTQCQALSPEISSRDSHTEALGYSPVHLSDKAEFTAISCIPKFSFWVTAISISIYWHYICQVVKKSLQI